MFWQYNMDTHTHKGIMCHCKLPIKSIFLFDETTHTYTHKHNVFITKAVSYKTDHVCEPKTLHMCIPGTGNTYESLSRAIELLPIYHRLENFRVRNVRMFNFRRVAKWRK